MIKYYLFLNEYISIGRRINGNFLNEIYYTNILNNNNTIYIYKYIIKINKLLNSKQ